MDSVVLINNSEMEEGKKILETNEFFQDLSDLMEDEKFVRFFNKHMSSWIDIKGTMTYMKLYDEFKKKYKKLNNEELDKSIVVYILSKIMKNKKLRPWSIKTIDNILSKPKLKFFDEFETFLLSNNEIKLLQ